MNLGMPEMIFIFLLALIIFGPKRLPEIARQAGKFMADFKRASNEFKSQLEAEVNKLEAEAEATKQQILPPAELPPGTIASGSQPEVTAAPKGADA